jgi:hypothetical protein
MENRNIEPIETICLIVYAGLWLILNSKEKNNRRK